MAHPRPAVVAADASRRVREVIAIVERDAISEVIVGLPLTMAGGDSDQTRDARAFAARLRAALTIPVTEWDERLSTLSASRDVRGAEKRRSGALDSAAAAVVLQSVLDSRRLKDSR